MKYLGVLCILLALHLTTVSNLAETMGSRPFVNRLGYVPQSGVLRTLSADQKPFVAFALILKVLMYFGGSFSEGLTKEEAKVNYHEMYEMLKTATRLDPYNIDSYYFAQAILTWDMGEIEKANQLLEYGMKYRAWDWYLPLFIGFNKAYFQKDYSEAAKYYELAGKLSGSTLYNQLAGRYLWESGQTELAIDYLKAMLASARNDAIKESFTLRLKALDGVSKIEQALGTFQQRTGEKPGSLNALLSSGDLQEMPKDPYGGKFFLDPEGIVRSTSKFSIVYLKRLKENEQND